MARLMEFSAARRQAPQRDPDTYCCLLDEQPTHLVPERLLRELQIKDDGELSFNSRCLLEGMGSAPDDLRAAEPLLSNLRREDLSLAWVQDAATNIWCPFGLTGALRDLVLRIQRDPRQLDEVPAPSKALLQQSGILVGRENTSKRRRLWHEVTARCGTKFHMDGWALVDGLIHPFHLAELRRYFRRQIRTGKVRLGDGQSPLRYIAHNDPAARFLHVQLSKAVSELVGERVKPSYVYMASYKGGARLDRHTDREQCEFSITLCLDYAPEPSGATPWPLYLDTARGTTTIYQAIGDGLVYRGRALPHYRKTLAQGNTSTSLFLHYVSEDYAGSLE